MLVAHYTLRAHHVSTVCIDTFGCLDSAQILLLSSKVSPTRKTAPLRNAAGRLDVEIGGLVLFLQALGAGAADGEARARGRCRVEVEGRAAGAGEAAGEAGAQGRCRVTVGMVG